MSTLTEVESWIAEQLPGLIDAHQVPGAAWAVLSGGEVVDGAAGVLSTATGVDATADSLFQIGSITKLWTSTLVMQLVDEGTIDLDVPVRTYLPDFAIGDQEAAATITPRHLLTHTSGFEGDIFTDTGQGEDCLEKFMGALDEVPQLFPAGERFSYNNAGFCVLGRLVEVLRDKPYDVCLREHLITPLGLTHAATGASEAILYRAAVGHIQPAPDAGYVPAPVWALPRSNAPAGSMLAMRPRDLVTFARMHLGDGRSSDGTQVLASGTPSRMHAHRVDVPDLGGLLGTSWGLGFERFDLPGGVILGHDGSTIGQSAYLRIVPESGVVVALLTNGGDGASLFHDVVGHVLENLTGTHLPPPPVPPENPSRIDAGRYVGTYSADVVDLVVTQDEDGRIWLDQTPKGTLAQMGGQPERKELVPYQDDSLIPLVPEQGMHMPHVFVGDDGDGHALYLHIGRAVRRAGT